MIMKKIIELDKRQREILRRISERGMKKSTMSLSQMVESDIKIDMLKVEFLPVSEIPSRVGGPEKLVMALYLRIMGDISGTSLLMLPRESALSLADILNDRRIGTTEILDREDRSALGEVSNILTASFLTELGNFTGIRLYHSTPCTVFNIAKSLMEFVLLGMDPRIEHILIIQLRFTGKMGEIGGDFILLFDTSSLPVLVREIDKKIEEGYVE